MARSGTAVFSLNGRIDRLPNWGLPALTKMVFAGAYFFAFFDIIALGAALPAIIKNLHISESQAALPLATSLLGYIVGSLVLGWLSDKFGRKRLLISALLLLAVCSVLCALVSTVFELAVFRFLVGAGIGAQIILSATYIAELSPTQRRARNLQLNVVIAGLGDAAAPIVAVLLANYLGPDAMWRILLGLGSLALIPAGLALSLPESPRWLAARNRHGDAEAVVGMMEQHWVNRSVPLPPPVVESDVEVKSAHAGVFRELLRVPHIGKLSTVTLYWFLLYTAVYGFLGFEPTLLNKLEIHAPQGLLYTALGDIALPLGAALPLLLLGRFSRRFILGAAALIFALGLTILGLSRSGEMAVLGAFVVALVLLINSGVGYTYTSEIFPTSLRGSAVGLADGIGHVGGVVAPYIVLGALQAWGARGAFLTMAAMMVVCAVIIAGLGVRHSDQSLH
jgi:putative MFS transporter